MKLDCIRFCNINSLKGKHEISFKNDPLASAGLFAITGPTGSGKSTILDVISLALYNYVPRLGKISRSNIEKMGSIVTHFTKEAWAEIEYTSKGKQYRSRWSIVINKNGNFNDYEMDIIELPEERSLGLKKSQIPDKNTEIIGLNIDQFMKSIMLSQGDFSKFLQAKKEDRTKLLEEITGTHIYRQLGKLAYEKVREKNNEIDQLRSQFEIINVLDEEGLSALDQQISHLKKDITKLESKKKQNDELLKILDNQIKIAAQEKQISDRKIRIESIKKSFEASALELENHNRAKEYEVDIESYTQLTKEIAYYEKSILSEKQNIESAKTQKIEALEQARLFTNNQEINDKEFYNTLIDFQKTINEFDSQLNALTIQGKDLRATIAANSSKGKTELIRSFKDIKKSEDALSLINQKLDENTNNSTDIEVLQSEWKQLVERSSIISDYKKLYSQKEDLRNQIEVENKWVEQHQNKYKKYIEDLRICQKKSHDIDMSIIDISKRLDQAKEEAKLEDHRELLEDGKPCPLCGAIHHPYSLDQKLTAIGTITLELDKAKDEKIQIEQEEHQSKENKLRLEVLLKNKIEDVTTFKINKIKIKENLELYTRKHSWILQIADETWDETLVQYESQIAKLNKSIEYSQEFKQLEQFKELFLQMQKITTQYQKINLERNTLYKGKELIAEVDAIQNKYTGALVNIKTGEESLKNSSENLESSKNKRENHISALQVLVKEFKFDETHEVLSLLLSNHNYKRITLERDKILAEESALDTLTIEWTKNSSSLQETIHSLSKESKQKIQESDSLTLSAENANWNTTLQTNHQEIGICKEKYEANNLAIEKRKKLGDQISQLMDGNKTWILLNQLIGDGTGKKFSNYAQNLTLMHLLTRANARLESLSDRYLLTFKPDLDDLLVIDTYQGDTMRAVKTLSGGETFLISLALALSLSDFASQNVQLQSLFIDEGFGTLDQETLDMAMSTLEKLQHNSGKQIGIISHVESLKERINVQIKVNKNARGYSDIEIIS